MKSMSSFIFCLLLMPFPSYMSHCVANVQLVNFSLSKNYTQKKHLRGSDTNTYLLVFKPYFNSRVKVLLLIKEVPSIFEGVRLVFIWKSSLCPCWHRLCYLWIFKHLRKICMYIYTHILYIYIIYI